MHINDHKCECHACTYGIDATRAREKELMEKYGWYAHIVMDDEQSPTGFNYHTHGFTESFNAPDIQIVIPIQPEIAHAIADTIVAALQSGKKFQTNQRESAVLQGHDVMFVEAVENGREVWRVVLPDQNNQLEIDKMDLDYAIQWHNLRPAQDLNSSAN